MQISALNSVNAAKVNGYSKINQNKNHYHSPLSASVQDTFTRSSVSRVSNLPIFEQNGKTINVVSFGSVKPVQELLRPAIQMRVQGVKNLQHNMDPAKMAQGTFSINRLADSMWRDGQKLDFRVDNKRISIMSKFGKLGRVPDEIAEIIMPVVKRAPKDFSMELSNMIAGNTKGASTIGLRVNLLYNGKDKRIADLEKQLSSIIC